MKIHFWLGHHLGPGLTICCFQKLFAVQHSGTTSKCIVQNLNGAPLRLIYTKKMNHHFWLGYCIGPSFLVGAPPRFDYVLFSNAFHIPVATYVENLNGAPPRFDYLLFLKAFHSPGLATAISVLAFFAQIVC